MEHPRGRHTVEDGEDFALKDHMVDHIADADTLQSVRVEFRILGELLRLYDLPGVGRGSCDNVECATTPATHTKKRAGVLD